MMKQISLMITSVALTFAMNICAQQSPWDKADAIVQSLNPVIFPDKTYVITDFGAVGDGKTLCKEAFEKAITICSDNGGGKITVPAGTYYMNGPLVFKSNVNVHLEKERYLISAPMKATIYRLSLLVGKVPSCLTILH